jgi:uncharacterized paraquat-inducible protein A
MSKSKHIHQYKRKKLGRDGSYVVFACVEPHCSHYAVPTLLEGKLAKCPRCGQPFTLDKSALSLAIPHCNDCVVKKDSVGEMNAHSS